MAEAVAAKGNALTVDANGSLTMLIPRDALQNIQDRFAALGRTTVCIGTIDGELITTPTWGSRFSEMIGTSGPGRAEWLNAVRACAEDPACGSQACNEGMRLYSAPIVYDGQRLAMIVVGTRDHGKPTAQEVERIAGAYAIDLQELLAAVAAVDFKRGGTPQDIQRFADVLAHILATLYGQGRRIADQLADLQTVHDLSQLLSGTLDLQQILNKTVRRVVDVMDIKACAIRLLNPETGELVIKAVCNLSDEYLNKGAVLLQNSPIDAAAFRGESVYIENLPTDPRTRYPDNARKEGIVSGLCVPLTYRGQTIGVIRVYTDRMRNFGESESSLLRSIGSQAAAAIIHSRLYDQQAKGERVRRQMEMAGEVQRRMLPRVPPPRNGLEFGCVYDPTLQIGGDFYDFIELPDGDLGLCIADVSGKGIPAALFMAAIRSSLRAYAPTSDDVTRIMRHVNRQMCNDTLVGEFATLFYGVLSPHPSEPPTSVGADVRDQQRRIIVNDDSASGEATALTYCNAGHQQPLILRGDKFLELTTGGMALGIRPHESFDEGKIELLPGDVMVLSTDGVTDALNFQGASYGHERFCTSIWKHRRLSAKELAAQLHWDVRRFAGLTEQADDITIVVVKVS